MLKIRNPAMPVLACLLAIVLARPAFVAAGALDPSFGGDGIVRTNLSSDRGGRDTAYSLAVQTDGRIVTVGRAGGAGGRFALARYESDGSPDQAFGDDGRVLTNLTAGADIAFGVAIQPDGKIVVAGRAGVPGGAFALVRYDSDGTLDTSFRSGGTVITRFDDPAAASGLAIQSDGKIVLVGRAGSTFALARYGTNGRLDGTFRTDGTVRTDFTAGRDTASAVAIQPDGDIVVAGTAGIGVRGGDTTFAVARYLADGALDSTFAGEGKLMHDLSSEDDIAHDVAIYPQGTIVVVGTSAVGGIDPDTWAAVIWLDAAGAPDPTFSDDGTRTMNVTNRADVATAVAVQVDDKIVVAGASLGIGRCCPTKAWFLRFTDSGRPDPTFDGGEVVIERPRPLVVHDLALQPDANIVAAGWAGGRTSRFAVLRLLGA